LTKCTSLDGRKYNIAACQLDIGELHINGPRHVLTLGCAIGNAATAMGGGAANGVPQADGTIKPEATFDVQEVGRAIVYMASLPLGANVFNMTLMYVPLDCCERKLTLTRGRATTMPFIARG
jgi:hypothetical protein